VLLLGGPARRFVLRGLLNWEKADQESAHPN
jgi:hypothetical protein